MSTSLPLYRTWLGYLMAISALAALALAGAALLAATAPLARREALERWAWWSLRLLLVVTVVATIVALATHTQAMTTTAIYTQFFFAASLFTLTGTLADWRGREAELLWKAEMRILYLAGLVGCVALSILLVGMG